MKKLQRIDKIAEKKKTTKRKCTEEKKEIKYYTIIHRGKKIIENDEVRKFNN